MRYHVAEELIEESECGSQTHEKDVMELSQNDSGPAMSSVLTLSRWCLPPSINRDTLRTQKEAARIYFYFMSRHDFSVIDRLDWRRRNPRNNYVETRRFRD